MTISNATIDTLVDMLDSLVLLETRIAVRRYADAPTYSNANALYDGALDAIYFTSQICTDIEVGSVCKAYRELVSSRDYCKELYCAYSSTDDYDSKSYWGKRYRVMRVICDTLENKLFA